MMTNEDRNCIFCGGDTAFMATIKDKVCLSCGDKLQAQGIYLMSKSRHAQATIAIEFMAAIALEEDELQAQGTHEVIIVGKESNWFRRLVQRIIS